jgi:hypothetical protein
LYELLIALFVVAATPLMVRHHFLIRAVPVADGAAEAEIVNMPETFELFVVDHATVGSSAAAETGLLVTSVVVTTTPTNRQKDARTLFSFTRLRLNPK